MPLRLIHFPHNITSFEVVLITYIWLSYIDYVTNVVLLADKFDKQVCLLISPCFIDKTVYTRRIGLLAYF